MSQAEPIENPDGNATFRVSIETWRKLNALRERPDDTFEDVVSGLLDTADRDGVTLPEVDVPPLKLSPTTNITVRRATRERLRDQPGETWNKRLARLAAIDEVSERYPF